MKPTPACRTKLSFGLPEIGTGVVFLLLGWRLRSASFLGRMKRRMKNTNTRSTVLGLVIFATLSGTGSGCATTEATQGANQSDNHSVQVTAAPVANAATYNQVCGICHLESGQGVPGAFPPLNARLALLVTNEPGRNYLVGIMSNGLYGRIEVGDDVYNGAMPALSSQQDSETVAGLLNYVLSTFAQTNAGFTAKEIDTRYASIGSTSGAKLRAAALSAHQ